MQAPQTLGKYRILGQLGRGGSGVVYRSEDPLTLAPLAIKTTLGSLRSERAALEREIAALTRLTRRSRRGVVTLLEAGVDAGTPWYAMPFVVGESLRMYQRQLWADSPSASFDQPTSATLTQDATTEEGDAGAPQWSATKPSTMDPCKLPAAAGKLREVLELGLALAECLHGIHDDGVVHGDVTPANVLLTASGEPMLVDFGAAFQLHQGDLLREVAQVAPRRLGTPGFMAPEQIRGEGVEPRSDLYALGCILYELVTGVAPFRADTAAALLRQHVSMAPSSPRALVGGVDDELERLLLGLLEKHPRRRPSRAADVVARLSAMVGRAKPPMAPPNNGNRLALYRPELVGRSSLLAELEGLLPRARGSNGQCFALAGPSGSGKTRVLNELCTRATALGFDVISTSSANPAIADNEVSAGLASFGSVLSQLALRARTIGIDAGPLAEALAVLAPYAPDGLSDLALPPRRNVPGRSDVVASLEQLVRACSQATPTLLVLDDLQWSDELSLLFVKDHVAKLADAEVVVVCGYRSEEIGERLATIRAAARRTFDLSPLELPHVYAIVRDMLATDAAPEGLPEFLLEQSGGNPFLIAEYLRAAVARGLVMWDDAGRFRFQPPSEPATALPESLLGLFSLRVGRLSARARAVLELAAVLGREFAATQLVALTRNLQGAEALEELVSEQILEYAGEGRYRFVHDKLREAQESAVEPQRRRELHRLAAEALEEQPATMRGDAERQAQLGMHWQAAGETAKALDYLHSAAQGYQSLCAHARAAALYRAAIAQCQSSSSGSVDRQNLVAELHERLGDTLLAQASHADARAAFERALATDEVEPLARARNLRKVASSHWRLHAHADAREKLEQAEQALPAPAAEDPPEVLKERIEIQLGKFEHLYFAQDRSEATERLLAALEEPIELHADPSQRVRYYLCAASDTMARARFAFDPRALEFARQGEGIAVELLTLQEEALAQFIVGFTLMLGDRDQRREALEHFARAERGAHKVGDRTLASRIAIYQALTLLRLNDVTGVREAAQHALELAETAKISIYVAAAHACAAWALWRLPGHDVSLVKNRAEEAQRLWHGKPASFPFRWSLSFVLLELANREQDLAGQASAIAQLLDPLQQKLPAELEAVLERVRAACAQERLAEATPAIDEALRLARQLGFC